MEDIIEYLKNELQKGESIKSISEKFQVSELEVLGFVYKLQEEGINIDYSEKDGVGYLIRNNHPDMSREETYLFKEDINITKIKDNDEISSDQLKGIYCLFLKQSSMDSNEILTCFYSISNQIFSRSFNPENDFIELDNLKYSISCCPA